ncbi:MAG: glycosyltransferase family 4 protein [Thaumarchaeota archaeon]|nr:glycosyltransferase family 4 protein [Nitrososphaerota archaeon]
MNSSLASSKLKILIVSSSFYPKIDGSTRCVFDHARKLAERGHLVYLVTRGVEGTPREELFYGIRVVRTSVNFRSGSFFNKAGLVSEEMLTILRLQRKHHFDVVHVHGCAAGFAAIPAKYLFGVPLFITTHGTELLWPRELWWKPSREVGLGLLFERFVLGRANVVIAQSPGVRRYMLKIYGDSISGKIRLVHTGVDHRKFVPPPMNGQTKQVLFVGALSEIKGVRCLLNAFGQVHREVPEARLVLVGSGPMANEYKELVRETDLNGSVEFQGPVRDDGRLLRLYGASDIVVLPSNVGGPISCTILEGLSCGRAVISTNVPGGIPDVLSDGAGLLMERGDEAALAAYLRRLMNDKEYLVTLEHNARAAVEERYTLDSMVEKLEALYSVEKRRDR